MAKMRPYARLLTMLGDQLIKNETIALAELIKNGYDADAEIVRVHFNEFQEDSWKTTDKSRIIIEDSGIGMTKEVILEHWLNPATPVKKSVKNQSQVTTQKGRVIQGEKGIGRFSLLKLGAKITIVTRPINSSKEYILEYDFSNYDEDFKDNNNYLFLDDLDVHFSEQKARIIVNSKEGIYKENTGTKIEISHLKGEWNKQKIQDLYEDIRKLRPIFEDLSMDEESKPKNSFVIDFFINHKKIYEDANNAYIDKLNNLLIEKAVIKIEKGHFNPEDDGGKFIFFCNGKKQEVKIHSKELEGIKSYKNFISNHKVMGKTYWNCGPFGFNFYIFDFTSKAPLKYKLNSEDKEIIKANRIYLYRDGLRVYPYGEKSNDWIGIDIHRGTISAGDIFANDQIVGFISISQKDNPLLKDKTSREGLIEGNGASEELVQLVRLLLIYVRQTSYARYRANIEKKEEINNINQSVIKSAFQELKEKTQDNEQTTNLVAKLEKTYNLERESYRRRINIAEDLAGVGLSVETASHDIMMFYSKALSNIDHLIALSTSDNIVRLSEVNKELTSIRGALSFVEAKLKNIQMLFRSSKGKRARIKVKVYLDKILSLFEKTMHNKKINCEIRVIGSPVIANTKEAVLMQVFINLLDNAMYWLEVSKIANPKIEVVFDGDNNTVIFADNGLGIDEDDIPYIFEAFYSGKGEEGRGLGLYIARQLLEKDSYSISLLNNKKDKILPGANFILDFRLQEE